MVIKVLVLLVGVFLFSTLVYAPPALACHPRGDGTDSKGCGKGQNDDGPVAATHVDMVKRKFDPKDALASLSGGSVPITWENHDNQDHNVHITKEGDPTFDKMANDGNNIAPGASGTFTFTSVGLYPYHCMIHPGMKGTMTINSP